MWFSCCQKSLWIFVVVVILIDYCIVIRTQGDRPCAHFEEKGYQEIYRSSSLCIGVSPAPFHVFNMLLSVNPNSCLMSQLQISPERCVDVSTKFPTTFSTASPERRKTSTAVTGSVAAAKQHQSRNVTSAGAIVGICIALVLVISVGAWCLYAYRNPASKAGLCVTDVGVFRFAKLNLNSLALTVVQLLLKYIFKVELIFAVTSFLVHLLRNPENVFTRCWSSNLLREKVSLPSR